MNCISFNIRKILVLLAFLFLAPSLLQAEIILADSGATDYRIVCSDAMPEGDWKAVVELSQYLRQITGAQFSMEKRSELPPPEPNGRIFIGWQPSSDTIPLAPYERRIKSLASTTPAKSPAPSLKPMSTSTVPII